MNGISSRATPKSEPASPPMRRPHGDGRVTARGKTSRAIRQSELCCEAENDCSDVSKMSSCCYGGGMLTRGVPCCPGKSCQRHEKTRCRLAPGWHMRVGDSLRLQSGRQDSNLRHLAPKASALPNCATPRRTQRLAVDVQTFSQVDGAADRSLCSPEARPFDPVAAESHGAGGAPLQLFWQRVVEGP